MDFWICTRRFGTIIGTVYYLLYDEGCSLCVRFQEEVNRRDRRAKIKMVGFEDPRIGQIVPGMSREELSKSFHLVLPGGKVLSGHRAMPELLRIIPGWGAAGWLLKRLPFSERISERIYAWIAARRG